MINDLFAFLSKTVTLTDVEKELCARYFESESFSKKSVLEASGNVPQYIYFVSAGYMRLCYNDENGDEHTTFLAAPKSFITPFLSFINKVVSVEKVECITDCDVLRISHTNLKALIDESENFKTFSLILFQQAIASTANRANDLATLNADQRYFKLMKEQPEIIRHVPLQYIASYLGVKPESLSRIRKNKNS